MALIIENGTGVAGADSFITTTELDAICTKYFDHTTTGNTATKESACRRAYLYMRSLSWKVEYVWPTFGGTIPADIKLAQGILAHFEKDTPNGLSPNVTPGQIKTLIKAGEIGWQANGIAGAQAQRTQVLMALDLLAEYTNARTIFLARA